MSKTDIDQNNPLKNDELAYSKDDDTTTKSWFGDGKCLFKSIDHSNNCYMTESVSFVDNHGDEESVITLYHPNGRVRCTGKAISGQTEVGAWSFFNEHGSLMAVEIYDNEGNLHKKLEF